MCRSLFQPVWNIKKSSENKAKSPIVWSPNALGNVSYKGNYNETRHVRLHVAALKSHALMGEPDKRRMDACDSPWPKGWLLIGSPFSSTIFRDCGSLHTVGCADTSHPFYTACGPRRCSTCDTSVGRSHARMTRATRASDRSLRKRVPRATCSSTLIRTIKTRKVVASDCVRFIFSLLTFSPQLITVGYQLLPTHLRIADNSNKKTKNA